MQEHAETDRELLLRSIQIAAAHCLEPLSLKPLRILIKVTFHFRQHRKRERAVESKRNREGASTHANSFTFGAC